MVNTGVAFAADRLSLWFWNDRNELTGSDRDDTDPNDWAYEYDPIGNRQAQTQDDDVLTDYVSNELNQYERWDRTSGTVARERFGHDADGNLAEAFVVGDMNCDGVANFGDINAFTLAVVDCVAYEAQYPDCDCMNADINGDGVVNFGDINPFTALLGSGNAAAARQYVWNAENRLVEVRPTIGTEQDGHQKVRFVYDYLGRRIEKRVFEYQSSAWTEVDCRCCVWSGWKLLMELDGLNNDAIVRAYTWGLDLAGQHGSVNSLGGAGTIGGLLGVHDETVGSGVDYVYFCDANGNVGQLIDWSAATVQDAIVAHYEYDPYGNIITQDGPYADENPFRFSTKQFDGETGMYYFGYRYYSPSLGRWTNQDPIAEDGGQNLYACVHNQPTCRTDPLGLTYFLAPWLERGKQPEGAEANWVQVCCRDTELCCCTNLLTRAVGAKHCWLRTATKEAGLGAAGGGQPEDNSSPCCGGGVPTEITDHEGEGGRDASTCYTLPGCDMDCVNAELQVGKATGTWELGRIDCNAFVRQVLTKCKCRNRCLQWEKEEVLNLEMGEVYELFTCIKRELDLPKHVSMPREPIPYSR